MQEVFRALADDKRRDILMLLSDQDMTIGDVVDKFDITRAAVKKHLKILEEGKLISVHVRGRERINRLEPMAFQAATEWLSFFSQYWDTHLNKLSTAIENEQGENNDKHNN
ncbi:MAG: metalloregulator ArsR/SmtB family transcription factor [Gammaproteobacteria bacterium]|nr:metalloregulator ArsR/SmtB family transcription factor [Gammaproteobacteria bacterium]